MMPVSLEQLLTLLATQGKIPYRDARVNNLEHALQCATLAQAHHVPPSLVAACLFHDVGHLLQNPDAQGFRLVDTAHEVRGMVLLEPLFGPAVTQPIRLHVAAKRYLCAVDPHYISSLSSHAQLGLPFQGGCFLPQEAEAFLALPYAQDAIRLRRWDDLAHASPSISLGLDSFVPMLVDLSQAYQRANQRS